LGVFPAYFGGMPLKGGNIAGRRENLENVRTYKTIEMENESERVSRKKFTYIQAWNPTLV
jgi:hypothetical protein